ncbi:hypothetical protein [Rhizobium sp. 18055]|jgi:hypothetical protein|nr:hypothetical protein [Rhizobium sp. 18055]
MKRRGRHVGVIGYSAANRVLGAIVLSALLWAAIAWAVMLP